MAKAPLDIERVGDVTVIRITAGSLLDGVTIESLGEELDHVVTELGRCRLIIDCSAVRLMSSAALGVFIRLEKLVGQAKGRIVFAGVPDSLMRSFKIANLHSLFTFHKTAAKALSSFK